MGTIYLSLFEQAKATLRKELFRLPHGPGGPAACGSDDDERLADCETVPEGSFGGSWTSWPGAKRAGFARAGYARMRDA